MLKNLIAPEYAKLNALFSKTERLKILAIFFMMLFASLLEVAGIGMIPVFIAILADPDMVLGQEPVGRWLASAGITTARDLLFSGAVVLIGLFAFKAVFMLVFHFIKTRFIFNRRYVLSDRLMTAYMRAPYSFHLQRNTSELMRNIISEVHLLINNVLNPTLDLAKDGIMILSIIVFLFFFEPVITVAVIVVLGGTTGLFLLFTNKKVEEYGEREMDYRDKMIKAVDEGLGGFKEARVLNREAEFIQTFKFTVFWSSRLQATTYFIRHIPKPLIETIAVGGMMLVAIIMVWQGRPLSDIIPVLTLFGVATVRLMPAAQTFASTVSMLKYGMVSVNPVHDDLKLLEKYGEDFLSDRRKAEKVLFEREIRIENVSYTYPESSEQALKEVTMSVFKGQAIAFVGSSGAGKTTIVDLLLGLIEPRSGTILVDGKDIHKSISAWQRNIGYIPQFIYLSDNTLRRNIAFGLPDNEIDEDKIKKAVKLAQLDELVSRLPLGLDTIVGQDGTRLSGGQRQRVGIARALYHEPEVLVMDEATSALDNITEKNITLAIEKLKGQRTIIMIAHRLTTVENCDVLFLMEDGKITDKGTYSDLAQRNRAFRKMALME